MRQQGNEEDREGITGEFVELNRMINRARSKAAGIGAESESSDTVAVVAKNGGDIGREERIVDGN